MSPLPDDESLERIALGIRRRSLRAAIDLNGAHLGQACSSAEILAVLHGAVIDHDLGEELVISPAHDALAHWCAMAERGRLDADLSTYARDGSVPRWSDPAARRACR